MLDAGNALSTARGALGALFDAIQFYMIFYIKFNIYKIVYAAAKRTARGGSFRETVKCSALACFRWLSPARAAMPRCWPNQSVGRPPLRH